MKVDNLVTFRRCGLYVRAPRSGTSTAGRSSVTVCGFCTNPGINRSWPVRRAGIAAVRTVPAEVRRIRFPHSFRKEALHGVRDLRPVIIAELDGQIPIVMFLVLQPDVGETDSCLGRIGGKLPQQWFQNESREDRNKIVSKPFAGLVVDYLDELTLAVLPFQHDIRFEQQCRRAPTERSTLDFSMKRISASSPR